MSGLMRKIILKAPSEVIDIAKEEALQYVLEEVEGETVPFITTAF